MLVEQVEVVPMGDSEDDAFASREYHEEVVADEGEVETSAKEDETNARLAAKETKELAGTASDCSTGAEKASKPSTASELNSEEMKESYRLYQEAIEWGLVPTKEDFEECKSTATSLKRSVLICYIWTVIVVCLWIWLFIFAFLLQYAEEVLLHEHFQYSMTTAADDILGMAA